MAADIRPTSKVTRENLLKAGMELLAQKGYEGAVTRAIAVKAGVTEQTLYRHYETKDKLLVAGIAKLTERLLNVLVDPTGNFLEDLLRLAKGISETVSTDADNIASILPEIGRHPDLLNEESLSNLSKFSRGLDGFFEHYKQTGELDDVPEEKLSLVFLGPIVTRVLFSRVFVMETEGDATSLVMHFLDGYKKHTA